jgi:hypothetical protein
MTRAATRVTTPRRTASKIKIDKTINADALKERRAVAYCRMDPLLCDADHMATIATGAMSNADGPQASEKEKNVAYFAVYHLCDMIHDLKRRYEEDFAEPQNKE